MTVEVEKVYPGFAVVLVDDKFRARLEASMFYDPSELIKKGRRFRARATVTKLNGKTAILIHDSGGHLSSSIANEGIMSNGRRGRD